jgi:hypothetical protein
MLYSKTLLVAQPVQRRIKINEKRTGKDAMGHGRARISFSIPTSVGGPEETNGSLYLGWPVSCRDVNPGSPKHDGQGATK